MKHVLTTALGLRLMDQEPEVRREAYLKLVHLGIKIEDFESAETRLLVIKEGMTDKDPRVTEVCMQFLATSIVEEVEVTIPWEKLTNKVKHTQENLPKSRRSRLIKSRRSSMASEMSQY